MHTHENFYVYGITVLTNLHISMQILSRSISVSTYASKLVSSVVIYSQIDHSHLKTA